MTSDATLKLTNHLAAILIAAENYAKAESTLEQIICQPYTAEHGTDALRIASDAQAETRFALKDLVLELGYNLGIAPYAISDVIENYRDEEQEARDSAKVSPPPTAVICAECGEGPILVSTNEILPIGTLFECSHCRKITQPKDYALNLEEGESLSVRLPGHILTVKQAQG